MIVLRPATFRFPHACVEVCPDARTVTTRFHTGETCTATRDVTLENEAEAVSEGYYGADGVWRCLVDHELCHHLIADRAWGGPSRVLCTEARKGRPAPYHLRVYEEAVVISFQLYLNSAEVAEPLWRFAEQLPAWREAFKALRAE